MKYRKKPVEIEAFQYNGDFITSDGTYYVPDWAIQAYKDGVLYFDSINENEPPIELVIRTSDGGLPVYVGEYIIKADDGEIYTCDPDIFERAYDLVKTDE